MGPQQVVGRGHDGRGIGEVLEGKRHCLSFGGLLSWFPIRGWCPVGLEDGFGDAVCGQMQRLADFRGALPR